MIPDNSDVSPPNSRSVQTHSAESLLKDNDFEQFFKNYKVVSVYGDGYCFVHSVVASASCQLPNFTPLTKERVLALIEMQLLNNLDQYSAFLVKNHQGVNSVIGKNKDVRSVLVDLMNAYITHGHYNTSFGDFVPLLCANSLGLNIGIVTKSGNNYNYKCITSEKVTSDYICVFKEGLHYDSLKCDC